MKNNKYYIIIIRTCTGKEMNYNYHISFSVNSGSFGGMDRDIHHEWFISIYSILSIYSNSYVTLCMLFV